MIKLFSFFNKDDKSPNAKELEDANISIDEWHKINDDFTKWNKIMFNAYQTNLHLFTKLKEEIANLHTKLNKKNKIIRNLTERNRNLENELLLTKKRSSDDLNDIDCICDLNDNVIDDNTDLDKLIQELKSLTKSNRDV